VRIRLFPLLACVAVLLAAGCGGGGRTGADGGSERLRVVATTTPVQDFVRVIGGDKVAMTGILKPNVDAHEFEPSPADLDAIARADVVVANGVGLEKWLDDTIRSAGFSGPVVDASKGVALRQGVGDEAGDPDPHIWHNPRNAKVMVANIAAALAAADPTDAATYRANLAAYDSQLDALDADIARRIDGLANRKLVTNHDAFGYYADRYGLEVVGSIIPSFDTSAELSGADLRKLVAKVKAAKVKAIFSEAELPPKTAETVGEEAGVRVVAGPDALYGDGLGPAGADGATYQGLMKHNTNTLVSARSGA
jgi:zinc/manganese transport system substrate-binding protein/manganese/iron transport system substrate-binding protein